MIELLFKLFIEFFKTGLFAVGGGLATIPFLSEIGEKYQWFSDEILSMMIAISESTPGPMGVNMATYVGYDVAGFLGGIVATLSLVSPSIIVICIIANYFEKFKDAKIVKMIFNGIKPAVIAFIIAACLNLFISTLLNLNYVNILDLFKWKCVALVVILLFVSYKYPKLHPIVYILASAVVGIVFSF